MLLNHARQGPPALTAMGARSITTKEQVAVEQGDNSPMGRMLAMRTAAEHSSSEPELGVAPEPAMTGSTTTEQPITEADVVPPPRSIPGLADAAFAIFDMFQSGAPASRGHHGHFGRHVSDVETALRDKAAARIQVRFVPPPTPAPIALYTPSYANLIAVSPLYSPVLILFEKAEEYSPDRGLRCVCLPGAPSRRGRAQGARGGDGG